MSKISSYTVVLTPDEVSHSHPHAHILIPLGEECEIRYSDRRWTVTPKQIIFVPPACEHAYSGNGSLIVLNIPAEMIKSSDMLFFTENPVMNVDEKLELLIALIKQEIEDRCNADSLRYLFYYLYDKFVERYKLPSLQYIHDNYAGEVSVAQLAAIENYNVSYYTDWFKKKVGCLPSEYLKMVRIDRAKEILATTKYKITDIAMQVGYCNSSSFTRAFKASEGISPHQYRKLAAGGGK